MEIVYFTILYSTNSWVLHSIKTKNIYKRHTTIALTRWWNSQQNKSCTPEGVPTALSPTPRRRSRSLGPSGLPSKWKPSRWQVPQQRRHSSRVPIDGTVSSKERGMCQPWAETTAGNPPSSQAPCSVGFIPVGHNQDPESHLEANWPPAKLMKLVWSPGHCTLLG